VLERSDRSDRSDETRSIALRSLVMLLTERTMITGMHAVIHTRDAAADRAFFRDVLGFSAVDAGGGWLIFAAPPSEVACHPADSNGKHELYLMCDDVEAEIALLGSKGISCGSVSDEGWGLLSTVRLPGGGDLGLYQPRHAVPHRG
jgi:catechol 2,3-dioxygenase-like lactoylglutathione lyase family enzyme